MVSKYNQVDGFESALHPDIGGNNFTNVSKYLQSVAQQPGISNLRSDGSLELLDGVHLVAPGAGEGGEGGRLLSLDRGVELLLQQGVPRVHGGGLGHLVITPRPLGDLLCGRE